MKNLFRWLTGLLLYFLLTTVAGIYLLFFLNLQIDKETLENKIELTVFLKDNLAGETIAQLGEKLRDDEKIREVNYTSKDDALKEFQKEPLLSRGITLIGENPLPASFTIYPRVYEKGAISELSARISTFPEVEKIVYEPQILAKHKYLTTLSELLQLCNYIFLGVACLIVIIFLGYTTYTSSWSKFFHTLLEQVSLALLGILNGLLLLYLLSKTLKGDIIFLNLSQIFYFFLGMIVTSLCLSFYLNLQK